MGREVRRVPATWQHPKNRIGDFKPLEDGATRESFAKEWLDRLAKYGLTAQGLQDTLDDMGRPPDAADYMPVWTDAEADHLMMYENTSEGTPISPPFKTPEELARWLADNDASAFADCTATYEQWLNTIKRGSAVSAVLSGGVMTSGVAGLSETEE